MGKKCPQNTRKMENRASFPFFGVFSFDRGKSSTFSPNLFPLLAFCRFPLCASSPHDCKPRGKIRFPTQGQVKFQFFSGSDLLTCMLPTFCPPTIWAISLEFYRKLSILAAGDFLGACYRKAMTPKKLWTFTFSPPTVLQQVLTRSYPCANCLLKYLPNCLSPNREGFLSSFKLALAMMLTARHEKVL